MAGAGYKLFNTGDVLTAAQVNTYLMEQSVMVFANAAARTTALTGVVAEGMLSYLKDTDAVEVYNGSAWVASDDPNAIQNTIVDAKGDLIAASANDTPARLAVGNNGETLLADSATTTGLRWSPAPSTGNPVLNSAMQIWQRGTSNVTTASAYTADRWQKGAGTHFGVSRQTTSDTTNLPFIQYSARIQRTNGSSTTTGMDFGQNFESINSIPYAGRTVTLSYYARKGANYSATNDGLTVSLYTGTGTDQNVFTGFTGSAQTLIASGSLTSTWQRFSASATLPTNMTQMAIYAIGTPTGTAGANDWYEITGIQIDLGSTALPFRTYASTLAGELAACQRYYQKSYDPDDAPASTTGKGKINFTSPNRTDQYAIEFNTTHRVTMRGLPTLTIYSPSTGTAARVRDEIGGADRAVVAKNIGFNNGQVEGDSGVTTTANALHSFQWVASAEL